MDWQYLPRRSYNFAPERRNNGFDYIITSAMPFVLTAQNSGIGPSQNAN